MSESIDLVGERVRLRSTGPEDERALVAIRSTDEVRRSWRGDNLEAEFAEHLADDGLFQLTIETAGRIVGLIQFAEEEDADYRHASIDIYVDPAMHRRGYASDAIVTLVDHLFDERGHHRLTIDPTVDNQPAIACYSSVGFRPVGVMRQYERRADATWADGLLMELVVSDRIRERAAKPVEVPADLELKLLDPAVRGDRAALDALLHPEFLEVGASGREWSRAEIIDELVRSQDPGPVEVIDLTTHNIAPDAALVTYRTRSPARIVVRTSIWILDGKHWRIRFHQGIPVDTPVAAMNAPGTVPAVE